MATPLPDGRVPMDVLLDEQDAEFMAEWAAADAEALAELQAALDEVGERPLPADQLTAACDTARTALAHPGLTGRLLGACGGAAEQALPGDDRDLWLTLAAGVVSPTGEAAAPAGLSGLGPAGLADDETDEVSMALGALCALEHIDWLAAISTLTRRGPGTRRRPPTWRAMSATTVRRTGCQTIPATRTSTNRPSQSCFPTWSACGRCWAPSTRRSA